MSLAVSLLERCLAEAAKGGLSSVTRLSVELGALQSIEPDLLVEAFRAAALGSVAQGAVLELRLQDAQARCEACGQAFSPTYQSYVCPQCGKAEVTILKGKEMFLLSLSGEALDAAPAVQAAGPS